MTVIRFTDLGLRSLREGLYFDERTPAFGIRIGKRKSTWLVLKGPNRTKHRLGSFPALGYAAARKKALEALANPLERYVGPTFPEARAEYLTQDRWRPYTKYHVSRILHRYFDWKKPLDQINHRDVILAIDAIKAPSERLHGYRNLCALFNWCVPRCLQTSPMTGLKPPSRQTSRDRVLSSDEVRQIWHATDPETPYGKLIRLLILLGTRRGETVAIQADWLKDNVLTIPSTSTKNSRSLILPVPQIAIPLIQTMTPIKGFWRHKENLDKRSQTKNWCHHDCRRYYATTMQSLGVRLEVTEKLLNHISGSMAGIVSVYQRHDFWPEMQAAVDKYERHLISILAQ